MRMRSSSQAWVKNELYCQCLNSFSTGNSTLKQKLIELLTNRTFQEIRIIRQTYAALYNEDILQVLSNIRRNDPFANVVYLRMNEPKDRDAEMIRDSLFGWRVNLPVLIEVVCTRSSSELYSVKQAYHTLYGSKIEQDISQKIAGNFKEILLAVLSSSRKHASRIDRSMAMCDAKTLYEAVESGISVDWKTIMSIVRERNREQIKAILISYKELYDHEFSKFLKCKKCGKFGMDLRFVIRGIQYPEKLLSKQLRGAIQENDTRESVARIVITRIEDDIKYINSAFAAKTGWSLGNLVRRKFKNSGSHRNGTDQTNELVADFLLALLRRR